MLPAFSLRALLIGVGLTAVSCALLVQWPAVALLAFSVTLVWFALLARKVDAKRRPGYLSVIAFAFVGLLFLALVMPAAQRPLPRRNVCMSNMHQLGLALANYHANNGCYPPAYFADAHGRPLVSWRVLLLPYLENRQLYDEWKRHADEPWDGPHNIKLSQQVLEFFHCPSDPGPATETSYVAVVGPGTIWPGTGKVKESQIKDGKSNTILLVEVANSGINWMEPRDLDLKNRAPGVNAPSGLGVSSGHPGCACILFADGRVLTIDEHITDKDLQALLTIAGGETVRWP